MRFKKIVLWRPIKIDVTNWALSNISVYPSWHTVIQHEAALLVFIGRVVLLIKLNLRTHELILNLQIKQYYPPWSEPHAFWSSTQCHTFVFLVITQVNATIFKNVIKCIY